MTAEIPSNEPAELVAGDTWTWKKTLADYPAGTWTLKYYFHKSGATFTFNASADGTDHLVSVAKATTAAYAAGTYRWDAYAESATERFRVDSGELVVLPNLGTGSATDARAHAEKVLAAIDAVIETRATKDQESYSIQGRTLARTPLADLIRLRSLYRAEVARLRARERARDGLPSDRNVLTRF